MHESEKKLQKIVKWLIKPDDIIPAEQRPMHELLAEVLDDLYRRKKTETIAEAAKQLVESGQIRSLAVLYWYEREKLLNRGVGHLFHAAMKYIRSKMGKREVKEKISPETLAMISLLGLAAHHDIPSIKLMDRRMVSFLAGIIEAAEDPFFFLGRRPLRRFVRLSDKITRYIDLADLPEYQVNLLGYTIVRREDLEKIGRELGRNLSWADYVLKRLEEIMFGGDKDLTQYGIHPDEHAFVRPFMYVYEKIIDPALKNSRGEEFFRLKFGKHADFVLDLSREVEKINQRKKLYTYMIPDNYVLHLHAQVVPHACTSWEEVIMGLLHGPSVPVVLRDRRGKTVGRIFLTIAKEKDGEKYYVVYGDYEGKKKGVLHFKQDIIPLVEQLSLKHFGTKPVYHASREARSKLLVPHPNPWLPYDKEIWKYYQKGKKK